VGDYSRTLPQHSTTQWRGYFHPSRLDFFIYTDNNHRPADSLIKTKARDGSAKQTSFDGLERDTGISDCVEHHYGIFPFSFPVADHMVRESP
jgi:hypothetical protein